MIKLLLIPALILVCTIWFRFAEKVVIPLFLILVLGIGGVFTGTYMNVGFVAEHKMLLLLLLAAILFCILLVRFVDVIIIPLGMLIVLQAFGVISGVSALPKLPELPEISSIYEEIQQACGETEADEPELWYLPEECDVCG